MIKYGFLGYILLCSCFASAKDISSAEIDRIVENAMKVFSVPGVGIGVIQNGKIIHAKGYGVRSIENGHKVDADTYFGIASNSKGFTATALAVLVDDGLISWDDKVKDYLPNFQLSDPWVTEHFTIQDLLSHSTGLPLGSGDLMWWPDSNYSPKEVIENMKYLKPNRQFRTTYEYNNLPFIVAGEVIAAVTGKSYENFLRERIFKPLDMDRCTANTPMMANDTNVAEPHAVLNGKLTQLKRYLVIDKVAGSVAAAGIECSVNDLLKWELMHINYGKGLMSEETHSDLWQVYTPMTVSKQNMELNKTHFRGYGLGYSLNDYHGVKVISHGGALIGMYSQLVMVPEIGFAIAITTNQQSGSAYNVIKNEILNHILNVENRASAKDIFEAEEKSRRAEEERLKNLKGDGSPALAKENYIGSYHDDWWGDVFISEKDANLYFTSSRSPSLKGRMEHFEKNAFIVRWDDRSHEADAFVYFSTDEENRITGFTMKAISTRTDFSYDFHHINPLKQ